MTVQLPEGSLITVTMEVRLPVAATAEQISAWVNYGCGNVGGIALDNPLINHDPQPWRDRVKWDDSGYSGRREEYGHEKRADGATYYNVRYHRERRSALSKAIGGAK